SIVDDDVLPLNPPALAQPLPERLKEMWAGGGRTAREIADSVDLPRMLRLGSERRGEEGKQEESDGQPRHGPHPDGRDATPAGGWGQRGPGWSRRDAREGLSPPGLPG